MTARRFSVWQKLVALAPLLLVAVYLPGEMMLRCRMDGLLRTACCCAHEGEPKDSGPAFEAQDCCDREITANERPAVEAARRSEPGLAPAVALLPVAASSSHDPSPGRTADASAQRYGPPRGGPPIVLAKHAFLI